MAPESARRSGKPDSWDDFWLDDAALSNLRSAPACRSVQVIEVEVDTGSAMCAS